MEFFYWGTVQAEEHLCDEVPLQRHPPPGTERHKRSKLTACFFLRPSQTLTKPDDELYGFFVEGGLHLFL